MRPPIPYAGGKSSLAKRLLPLMPLHLPMYCEPFFGSGGIFFAKPKVKQEFINDLNGDVTNFFEVLRDYPEWLRRVCSITPYSRDEYYNCRDSEWPDKDTMRGKIECARRFWVLARQGMGAPLRNSRDADTKASGWSAGERGEGQSGKSHDANGEVKVEGWRTPERNARQNHQHHTAVSEVSAPGWRTPERLDRGNSMQHTMAEETKASSNTWHWLESWCEENHEPGQNQTRFDKLADRLSGVAIDNRDAVTVVQRYNREHCFLYLDPPYVFSTRNAYLYKYEMKDEQHIELINAAKEHKGLVAISGYNSELYDEHLGDWRKVEINVMSGLARGKTPNSKGKRVECLWMNYGTFWDRLRI